MTSARCPFIFGWIDEIIFEGPFPTQSFQPMQSWVLSADNHRGWGEEMLTVVVGKLQVVEV